MAHKHDLEFMMGTKDIICMYDDCDFHIYRDDILKLVETFEDWVEKYQPTCIEDFGQSDEILDSYGDLVYNMYVILHPKEEV